MTVTFCRMRPVDQINQLVAATRRREGTTVLEIDRPTESEVVQACEGGVLPVARTGEGTEAAAWVVGPDDAVALAARGVAGWRITVVADGSRERTLDALARSQAAYVRTRRSRVAETFELACLPGLDVVVSVLVDDVAQALDAVAVGARDLVLRDWDADRIGELRDALDVPVVERTAFPPGIPIDDARRQLAPDVFAAWLRQVDASGRARPRYEWAPGKDLAPPAPPRRLSAQFPDAVWVDGRPPEGLAAAGALRPILERALEGSPPTLDETEALLGAVGDQVDAVAGVADLLRQQAVGDRVTFVVNRNINYTNMCYFRCGFCAFSKGPRSLDLRGEPYLMAIDEIVARAREAWDRGATEVTLQGGIHPDFTGDFYVEVVEAIKADLPDMHIHGFTPLEVWQGAETLGVSVREFLTRLRDAGLGTLPGTAAEILDDDVRRFLCPDKIRTSQWAEVMLTAHDLGLRSTATIMFGHIDDPRAWANHLQVIRRIQQTTGGFTEMIPLPFVHMGSPIYLRGRARPGPTWDEVVLIHAVSRIALHGLVANVQASWVKLGLDGAARLLQAGCNDMGGTLMGEIITRSAGASHGQEVTPRDFERVISAAGREPMLRDTLYRPVAGRSALRR